MELVTNAIVLKSEPVGEQNASISLFTQALGKVEAKAISSRKITSKMAGHLQPLHTIRVRLAHKNGYRITDALTIRIAPKTEENIELLNFILEMTPPLVEDKHLWLALRETLKKADPKPSYRPILASLGFDTKFASCRSCGNKTVLFFSTEDFSFFCEKCGRQSLSSRKPGLIKI